MSLRMFLRRHRQVLIWSLVVAALLLTPGRKMPEAGAWDWLDKLVHALLFAIHCGLLARSQARSGMRGRALAAAVVVSGLYAVLLEAIQIWVPDRAWEWWDLAADLTGIALAALLLASRRARLPDSS